MGMYDHLRCKYPLPLEGANALNYQTKDTGAQWIDNYEIREDGTLWHESYTTRTEDDDKSPLGFWVHRENLRWIPVSITGQIRFYAFWDDKAGSGWVEWISFFVDGKLDRLILVKNER